MRSPRAWWYEGTGDVLDRDFYVMERLPGTVYERVIPQDLLDDPERGPGGCARTWSTRSRRSTPSTSAPRASTPSPTGAAISKRELDHWSGEVRRVQRGPLPGSARLEQVLRERRPEQCPTITLVHGDAETRELRVRGRRGHRGLRLGDGVGRRPARRHRLGRGVVDDARLVQQRPGHPVGRRAHRALGGGHRDPDAAPRVVPRVPALQDGRDRPRRCPPLRRRRQRRPAPQRHGRTECRG